MQPTSPTKAHEVEAWDFDATLAFYDHTKPFDPDQLGEPIPEMVEKLKALLAEGRQIAIFTARTYPGLDYKRLQQATESTLAIAAWCQRHIGQVLPITFIKLPCFSRIVDDRAEQVIPNTGVFAAELLEAADK